MHPSSATVLPLAVSQTFHPLFVCKDVSHNRGERGKLGQKNGFVRYEKNIKLTYNFFVLHCRACFNLFCGIFPCLCVTYVSHYRINKNFKNFQKSDKKGGKSGQIVSQMGQVSFH